MSNKKEILLKLKRLAERGINGEKENAEKLLNKMMKKYEISEEELDQEEEKIVYITLKNKAEKKICNQILYAYFNDASLWQKYRHRTTYYVKLTAAQEIEFKYMLSIYLNDFYKQQEIFINAFIQKNRIFPVNGPVVDIMTLPSEQKGKAIKAAFMAEGIEKTQIRKSLEANYDY